MIEFSFLLFMVVYWFSEGCTEGYTWADVGERSRNRLIFGSIDNGKPSGEGILDYHSWRLGENIGTVGCIIVAFMMGKYLDKSFIDLGLIWLGSWMVGYFVYERALNYVCLGEAFAAKGDYHLMNITIPRSNLFDWIICVLGLVIFYLGY